MNAETLVIISNICFLLLYCNDYFLLCKIFYYLHEMKKINDNRRENILFLFPRILIFISNTCTMYYCVLIHSQPLTISFSVYLSLDSMLLLSRIILYFLIKMKIKNNSQIIILRPSVGDDGKVFFRPTVVSNPLLDTEGISESIV